MAVEILLSEDGKEYKHLEHGNMLRMCIDQLKMLLFTVPGEVFGDPEYGIDLKAYLWELQLSAQDMKNYILKQIGRYVKFSKIFTIDVQVRLINGDITTSAFIDITIDGEPALGIHVK